MNFQNLIFSWKWLISFFWFFAWVFRSIKWHYRVVWAKKSPKCAENGHSWFFQENWLIGFEGRSPSKDTMIRHEIPYMFLCFYIFYISIFCVYIMYFMWFLYIFCVFIICLCCILYIFISMHLNLTYKSIFLYFLCFIQLSGWGEVVRWGRIK